MANVVKDMSGRTDSRVSKSLKPTGKGTKKTAKKSRGTAKSKPFPQVETLKPATANATRQATSNCAVGRQSIASKDIRDIRNDQIKSVGNSAFKAAVAFLVI